jgi:hypothetical protein
LMMTLLLHYGATTLPGRSMERVTSIGFDDIAMSGFEAKLCSYLGNKR